MDFFDILLAKKLEDDRDPVIEGLSVTENGTYSEEGKAYNPVIVNVPKPTLITKTITANGTYTASDDNADGYSSVTVAVEGFKVKDMPAGAISSFNDGTDNPLKELKVSIAPQQASGTPTPQAPIPIYGWTGAEIHRADGATPHIIDDVYNISWSEAGEVYDGYIDYERKKVVVNRIDYTITSTRDFAQNSEDVISMAIPSEYRADVIPQCECFEGITKGPSSGLADNQCRFNNGMTYINFKFSAPKTVDEWKAELAINPIKLLLGLVTPIEYDLDEPVPMITTLSEENNIWANCGDVISGKYFANL